MKQMMSKQAVSLSMKKSLILKLRTTICNNYL